MKSLTVLPVCVSERLSTARAVLAVHEAARVKTMYLDGSSVLFAFKKSLRDM